jgi:hypothetical protein
MQNHYRQLFRSWSVSFVKTLVWDCYGLCCYLIHHYHNKFTNSNLLQQQSKNSILIRHCVFFDNADRYHLLISKGKLNNLRFRTNKINEIYFSFLLSMFFYFCISILLSTSLIHLIIKSIFFFVSKDESTF